MPAEEFLFKEKILKKDTTECIEGSGNRGERTSELTGRVDLKTRRKQVGQRGLTNH